MKQRAVVTGASSGIGKEFAKQLAGMGYDLVLAARRKEKLESLARELREVYLVQVQCIAVDLSQSGSSTLLFKQATEIDTPITLLINNAGIGYYAPFMESSLKEHQAVIQLNSTTPTELTYLFVEHMMKHGIKSRIAQISSIAAFQPTSYFSVYSATKRYLKTFSETLAFELRNSSVSVTCVCPGGTYTEFFESSGQKITQTGHLTMMSAERVASLSLKAIFKEKRVFVPGLLNKIACFLPRFVPGNLAIYLAFKTMSQSVERVQRKVANVISEG